MRLTLFGFKGLLFYLALTGAYLASPYSNIFFLLVGFLTLQWLLCVVWTGRNVAGLVGDLGELEPVPAGSPGRLRARVHAAGGGRRTRFQVAVVIELEDGRRLRGQVALLNGAADVDIGMPSLSRGLYRIRRAYLASSYPLGLLQRRRAIEAPPELAVYPQPADLVAARSGAQGLAEALGADVGGAGDLQPSGLREFREGDSLRAIHWRSSARRGKPVVREWEGGGGEGLEVLLDRRCTSEQLEQALRVLSAVVGLARENKEPLALYSQGLDATFGLGQRPWRDALRFLAAAHILSGDGPPPPAVSASVARLPQVVRSQRSVSRVG